MNNLNDHDDYVYVYREPNSIELIGYAMNDISKAKELETMLPTEYSNKLSRAYTLLDEVQEYLYEH